MDIDIVPFESKFTKEIIDICYKTGFSGADLTGKGIFEDKKLFGLLFCKYYLLYEPQNCFVAIEKQNVIGYIIGTLNTHKQLVTFQKKMIPRILFRLLTYTFWLSFKTFRKVIAFAKIEDSEINDPQFMSEYPAHLHMNIYENYQGKGIGTMLMGKFLNHVKANGIHGIHLGTSNYNTKAIPFYEKMGFNIHVTSNGGLWSELDNLESIIFVKKL